MNKLLTGKLALILAWFTLYTQAILAQDFAHPESIVSDGGRYFVSNIGQKLNIDKDGDGFIAEADADGKLIKGRLFGKEGKLNAPKGMAIIGKMLYVTDIDRIVGFNLSTDKKVFELALGREVKFLNDLVATDGHTLYASDTFGPALYKIDVRRKTFRRLALEMLSVNGLAYDQTGKVLYLNSMGKDLNGRGKIFSGLPDREPLVFTAADSSPEGVLDGISILHDEWLITTDWVSLRAEKGRILLYNLSTHQSQTLPVGLKSPADFYFDSASGKMYIPQTLNHKITVFQIHPEKKRIPPVSLYHYNLITSFLEGMYRGKLTYGELKGHGDFGIGAPNDLDGEVTIQEGVVYQTQHTGSTFVAADSSRTSYAFVHPFVAEVSFTLARAESKEALEQVLDSLLENPQNGMYAIRISAVFDSITTRAFPAVQNTPGPSPKLYDMLERQQLFNNRLLAGKLIGYRLPAYLSGVNIPGFHFHFLSSDHKHGGHVLGLSTKGPVQVEIQSLDSFEVNVPVDDPAFRKVEFKEADTQRVKAVESGEKTINR